MFVKLAVLACSMAVSMAAWHGPLAGGKPADLYPAGVSPSACPNYPHCNNPAIAANPSAPSHGWNGGYAGGWNGGHAGGWNGAGAGAGAWNGAGAGGWNGGWNGGHDNGQWNGDNGAWNGNHDSWNQNALDRGDYTGDGDYHGEGLQEAGAYGDVSQGYNDAGAYAGAPAGGYASGYAHAANVPAGVDPHSCPNYPFCH